MLVGVVLLGIDEFAIATTALFRVKRFDIGGGEKLLTGTFMALFPSRFSRGLF